MPGVSTTSRPFQSYECAFCVVIPAPMAISFRPVSIFRIEDFPALYWPANTNFILPVSSFSFIRISKPAALNALIALFLNSNAFCVYSAIFNISSTSLICNYNPSKLLRKPYSGENIRRKTIHRNMSYANFLFDAYFISINCFPKDSRY